MIQKLLHLSGVRMPWTRLKVWGYVDVLAPASGPNEANFTSWLYCPESLQDKEPEQWGEIIRARFAQPEGQLVLRPAWNERPNEYVAVPEAFWPYLRPGDWVKGKTKQNRNGDEW